MISGLNSSPKPNFSSIDGPRFFFGTANLTQFTFFPVRTWFQSLKPTSFSPWVCGKVSCSVVINLSRLRLLVNSMDSSMFWFPSRYFCHSLNEVRWQLGTFQNSPSMAWARLKVGIGKKTGGVLCPSVSAGKVRRLTKSLRIQMKAKPAYQYS